ncbi:MAG: hypothetical protein RIS68_1365 [Bacteroidota bacterium]|jgi:hypothetical protein
MKHSSEKDWNSIESTWRKKMQEDTSPVPEGMWENLSNRLDAEEKPNVFLVKTWPWAAVLVIGLGLSYLWFLPKSQEITQVAHLSTKVEVQTSISQAQLRSKSVPNDVTENLRTNRSRAEISKVDNRQIKAKIEELVALAPGKEEVAVQKNSAIPTNAVEINAPDKEETVWIKVEIDPIVRTAEEEKEHLAEVPEVKKRSLGQLLKKIKQVVKGNPGEWSEIKENFHLVAHKYVQTEETIKQKIQFQ